MPELFDGSPHSGLMNEYVPKCITEETYDVHLDANNVKLPGSMWGLHTNGKETLFTHITGLKNDKCVRFSSSIPQVFIIIIIQLFNT